MNFLLSSEQNMLMDALRELLADVSPARRVHEVINQDRGFDAALWARLVEYGVPGMVLPQRYGGLGLELIDLACVAEILGEFAAPSPFLGHALAGLAIFLGGSEAQRERWLPDLASGAKLASVALGEADAHWLPEEWKLACGEKLGGVKKLVPNAREADLLVVGIEGGGLAVAERSSTITSARIEAVDRTRPLDHVTFADTPAEPLEAAPTAAPRLIDAAAILLAADAFGGASRCVSMSSDYSKIREQFGVPIGSFQALKHQLANMALEVEPGRGLYWYAAYAFDKLPERAAHAAAQAKAHICDAFVQAARDTVEAHGGIGFTWEHDAHIYLKRAMFDFAWLGQPSRHRMRAADLAGW
ncbi:MAG TPA: acyl-CoA dehydrogenase family protein [Steroidobacteraceae bacterium]|jgi:alkylation response protein AidB-like acyl-CoA dehydrogenase